MSAKPVLNIDLEIPINSHGADLKELQVKFVNLLGQLNEVKDRNNTIVSARKTRIADLRARAIREVMKMSEFLSVKSSVQAKVLESLIRDHYITVPYQASLDTGTLGNIAEEEKVVETTISIEEHMLNTDNHKFTIAKSKAEELIQKLWVCRSGLSFDKEEMAHLSGVN